MMKDKITTINPLDQPLKSAIDTSTKRKRDGTSDGARNRKKFLLTFGLMLFAVGATTLAQSNNTTNASGGNPQRDSQKLGQRLIRQAKGEHSSNIMEEILRLMEVSVRRLVIDFDVSEETQSVQADILERLDVAIQKAASKRRPRRNRQPSSSSDKRQMAKKPSNMKKTSPNQSAAQQRQASAASGASGRGEVVSNRLAGGDLLESRRSWGHLPFREREEIIQGIGDRYLERYRDWVEQYYRALQESGQ